MMRNILLISFLALALSACSKDGGGGGGGGVPAPRACVVGDIPNASAITGSFYSSTNNNCVVTACVSGYTPNSFGTACNPVSGGGGTGGNNIGAPSITYSPNVRVAVVGTVMVALTPSTINCSAPATCSFALQGAVTPPAGINFDPATGTFSGLATEVSSRLLTVRVQNNSTSGINSATTTVQINIIHPIPAGLAINGTSGTNYYAVGVTQILNITYSSAPGSVTGITVSPALPAGLSLQQYQSGSNPQWRISGTPTAYSPKQTYTLTATGPNTNGTATLNFQLGVLNPPSNYSYNLVSSNPLSGGTGCVMDAGIPKCVFNKGQSFIPTNPTVTGDNLVYSVVSGGVAPIPNTELPAGILLSAATGVFTTTDSGAYENTLQCSAGGAGYCLYTLRAANELGSTTTQIKIRINGDAPPSGFSYAGNNGAGKYLFREVTNVGNNAPTWVGNIYPSCQGQAGCYTISPALPNGLNFSELSGRIQGSGELGVLTPLTTYTITAHDQQGNLTAQVQIEIKERIPVFEYTQNADYTLQKAVDADVSGSGNPRIVQKSGGNGVPDGPLCGQLRTKVTSFSISPALPPGLSLNTGSYECRGTSDEGGAITGIPTSLTDSTVYTVTGCNTGGCGTATFTLQVAPKITKIVTGSKHACAIVQESQNEAYRVMCWGQNDKGQLGYTSNESCGGINCQTKPRYVRMANNSIMTGVESLTVGANHTCALMQPVNAAVSTGGQVYCWGDNSNGQLGVGSAVAVGSSSSVPSLVVRSDNYVFKKVADISAGGNKTCLSGEITTSYRNTNGNDPDLYDFIGQVYCTDSTGKMVKVSDPSETVSGSQLFAAKSITVGDGHACAHAPSISIVTNDNITGLGMTGFIGIKCWGDNSMGQLGVSSPASSANPVVVSSITAAEVNDQDGNPPVQVLAGGKHTCFQKANLIKCWGSNEFGQLGRSTSPALFSSTAAAIPLGSPNTNTLNSPMTKGLGSGANFTLFAQNPPTNAPVGVIQTLSTYISGKIPLSGAPYSVTQVTTPISILDNSYDGYFHGGLLVSSGASTQDFACAAGDNGGLSCWGNNDKGQLGNGTTTNSVTPIKLKYLTN